MGHTVVMAQRTFINARKLNVFQSKTVPTLPFLLVIRTNVIQWNAVKKLTAKISSLDLVKNVKMENAYV